MKTVRITLELSSSFVRLLNANCALSGITPPGDRELDPAGVLALLVLMEARGATEAQIDASTPRMWEWPDGPRLVHGEREVSELATQTEGV